MKQNREQETFKEAWDNLVKVVIEEFSPYFYRFLLNPALRIVLIIEKAVLWCIRHKRLSLAIGAALTVAIWLVLQ